VSHVQHQSKGSSRKDNTGITKKRMSRPSVGEPENGNEARETNADGHTRANNHEQGLLVFTLFVMCLMLFSSESVKAAPVEQLAPLTIAGTESCKVVQVLSPISVVSRASSLTAICLRESTSDQYCVTSDRLVRTRKGDHLVIAAHSPFRTQESL
jgi:hypothetical protein